MTTRATRSPRRRTVVALAVVLAVLAGFIVRLVDIQVVNADDHIADSMGVAFGASRVLYGERGPIIDQTGQPLAGSVLRYDAQLDPSNVRTIKRKDADGQIVEVTWEESSAQIAEITGQSPEEVRAVVDAALAANPDSQYAPLAKGLTTQQYRSLVDLGIPFLYFDTHPARAYPDGAVAGNLVGFVGSDGQPLAGLEMSYDDCLTAQDGKLSFHRGADGVIIPGTEVRQDAVDGGTLQLTINRDLQWFLQQLIAEQVQDMGAASGSIMVAEVETGKVRALAEYPTVDPNDVRASEEPDRGSRAFRNWFEPGSTFKALSAAMLIDAAGQTPNSTVTVASEESFANGARVRDAFRHPAYEYTLTGVLIDSSNAGIARFSEKLDPQTRYDYLKKFGIGSGSAIGFPGEQHGDLRPATQWDPQTVYNTAYGQGLTTTLPELVGAYAGLVNDGKRMPLSIVEACTLADGTVIEPDLPAPTQVVTPRTSAQMRAILENVALQANYATQIEIPGYRIGVKTGTGEKSDGNGGYKSGAYFTTMIGFAPADDPKYVVAVTLDEPSRIKSSGANAPAFQKAMTQVLKTYRVKPATEPAEVLPKFG